MWWLWLACAPGTDANPDEKGVGGDDPGGVPLVRPEAWVLVAQGDNGTVTRHDEVTGALQDTFVGAAVVEDPRHFAQHGDRLFISNGLAHDIVVVDAESGEEQARWLGDPAVCQEPSWIAVWMDDTSTRRVEPQPTEDTEPELIVACEGNDRVLRLDAFDGVVLGDLVEAGSVPGPTALLELERTEDTLRSLVASRDGDIFEVADGLAVRSWRAGLGEPRSLAWDPRGDAVLAADLDGGIFRFDLDGTLLGTFSAEPLPGVSGISVDEDGTVWATLPTVDRIERFDPDGTSLGDFADARDGLAYPQALWMWERS